jgi:propanol-preferring alcohol dehydrogenase
VLGPTAPNRNFAQLRIYLQIDAGDEQNGTDYCCRQCNADPASGEGYETVPNPCEEGVLDREIHHFIYEGKDPSLVRRPLQKKISDSPWNASRASLGRNRRTLCPVPTNSRLEKRNVMATRKMNAAVVEHFGKPLVLREWDIPTPGVGQIVVKTEACGVCHTDLHAADGDWPVKPTLPFIPGHEAVGLVSAVGAGVTIVKEGDRVGVPWLYSACGHCEYCLSAWETVCNEAQFGGYTKNGGFAEYVLADPDYVAHIPKGLAPAEAAPLICAGITTYKGIKQTGAKPGQWIAISGCGGLGHLGIQYAKAMGLLVCAVDIDDRKLAHAKKLGADLVINAKHEDPGAAVKKGTDGGAHGVLITAPSLIAFKQGIGMTRKRGTCVLVGLPPGEFPVPLFDVVANCITVRGSFVGTREDMAEALDFAVKGKVKADIELQPLSAINEIFKRLEHGDIPARVVLDYSTAEQSEHHSTRAKELVHA